MMGLCLMIGYCLFAAVVFGVLLVKAIKVLE